MRTPTLLLAALCCTSCSLDPKDADGTVVEKTFSAQRLAYGTGYAHDYKGGGGPVSTTTVVPEVWSVIVTTENGTGAYQVGSDFWGAIQKGDPVTVRSWCGRFTGICWSTSLIAK